MSDWASKLQRKDPAKEAAKEAFKEKPRATHQEAQKENAPLGGQPSVPVSDKKQVKPEVIEFNGDEVAQFLKSSYLSALEEAKKDKGGEKFRVYQSLESPSGWSRAVGNKKEDRHMSVVTEVARQLAAQKRK